MTGIIDPSLPSADIGRIKRSIPHRPPFLFVDKVVNMVAHRSAVGLKNVTISEPFFVGHFPDEPVMPGVVMVESMAQTAAVLVNFSLDMIDRELSIYLLGVDRVRFRQKVVPGDVLQLHVEVLRGLGRAWRFACEAKVEDRLVASAQITAVWELRERTEA